MISGVGAFTSGEGSSSEAFDVWTIPRIYYFFLIAIVARNEVMSWWERTGVHLWSALYWCPVVVGTCFLSPDS